MGYSIYVSFKEEKEKDRVYEILKKEFKDFNKLMNSKIELGGRLSDDLSYTDHKYVVGFDFSSWIDNFERHYLCRVLSCIARSLNYDYYWYDGCEKEFITDCNEFGYKPLTYGNSFVTRIYNKNYSNNLQIELKRLLNLLT